jgi:hypothetical protein
MIGPGQPDKTSGPPGPVGFTKQPAQPERIFCWARPGRAARFEPCGVLVYKHVFYMKAMRL